MKDTASITQFRTPQGKIYKNSTLTALNNNLVEDLLKTSSMAARLFDQPYVEKVEVNDEKLNTKTVVLNETGEAYLNTQIEKYGRLKKLELEDTADHTALAAEIAELEIGLNLGINDLAAPEDLSVITLGKRGGLHDEKTKLSKHHPKGLSMLEENVYKSLCVDQHLENHAEYILGD